MAKMLQSFGLQKLAVSYFLEKELYPHAFG